MTRRPRKPRKSAVSEVIQTSTRTVAICCHRCKAKAELLVRRAATRIPGVDAEWIWHRLPEGWWLFVPTDAGTGMYRCPDCTTGWTP